MFPFPRQSAASFLTAESRFSDIRRIALALEADQAQKAPSAFAGVPAGCRCHFLWPACCASAASRIKLRRAARSRRETLRGRGESKPMRSRNIGFSRLLIRLYPNMFSFPRGKWDLQKRLWQWKHEFLRSRVHLKAKMRSRRSCQIIRNKFKKHAWECKSR